MAVGVGQSPDGQIDRFQLSAVLKSRRRHQQERNVTMLYTFAIVLVALWLLGLVTSYTIGGFIHILLVVAVITVLIRVIQGRKLV
jgi:predicted lysophospholipase L1 biosynthesis ABC-type transport system permease subunit